MMTVLSSFFRMVDTLLAGGDMEEANYAITLLGDKLDDKSLKAVSKLVPIGRRQWLQPLGAVMLFVPERKLDLQKLEARLPDLLPHVDWVVEMLPRTPKKLLISDMDSTMIEQECIDELADFVGKKQHVAAITERAMNGELVFEEALRERVALLKGLPVSTLQECFDKKITPMGGAKELVTAFKKQGGKAVLVSGGFTFFTERVAKMLCFDEHYSNILEIEDGKLTGMVREPILGKEAKLAELNRQCELLSIEPKNVIAIGDGANDLPMLKAAGLGIAYHAKPTVQSQVNARINHGDLSSIQYLF
jgi:phosphoserine phosphatase